MQNHELDDLIARARSSAQTTKVLVIQGWVVELNLRQSQFADSWWLSARLEPHGRSSEIDDWKNLGLLSQYLFAKTGGQGEAAKTLLTPFDKTHPNDWHHWTWQVPKAS